MREALEAADEQPLGVVSIRQAARVIAGGQQLRLFEDRSAA
jgi:hypothetical protein